MDLMDEIENWYRLNVHHATREPIVLTNLEWFTHQLWIKMNILHNIVTEKTSPMVFPDPSEVMDEEGKRAEKLKLEFGQVFFEAKRTKVMLEFPVKPSKKKVNIYLNFESNFK